MSYVPDSALLNGLSLAEASCMGMPHVGCSYRRPGDPLSHRRDRGARCFACGRSAVHAHHEPPLGMGGRNRSLHLRTTMGTFVLLPALIALCPDCHMLRHQGPLRFAWRWYSDDAAERWWSGGMPAGWYTGNDPALFRYGEWLKADIRTGRVSKGVA